MPTTSQFPPPALAKLVQSPVLMTILRNIRANWRIASVVSVFLVVVVVGAVASRVQQAPTIHYLWQDNFSLGHLDTRKWTPLQGGNFYTPPTLEYYTTSALQVNQQGLTITAAHSSDQHTGFAYTSGGISSKGKFALRYGTISWRFALPSGPAGVWPAIWLLPADGSDRYEIDAMEFYSNNIHTLLFTNHYKDAHGQQHFVATTYTSRHDLTTSAHTVTLIWQPNKLQWLLDNVVVKTETAHIPDVPMFMYINMAVGGLGGTPNDQHFSPRHFQVSYVRVVAAAATTTAP